MIMSSYILSVIYIVLNPQETFIFIEAIFEGAIYYWKGDALETSFLYLTRSKNFSPKKQKEDLGMACHTPPLKKGKCHYPASVPSH